MINIAKSLLNLGSRRTPTSGHPILPSASTVQAPSRRGFLFGATALLAAPSIVRVSSLMPISVPKMGLIVPEGWTYVERMTTELPFFGSSLLTRTLLEVMIELRKQCDDAILIKPTQLIVPPSVIDFYGGHEAARAAYNRVVARLDSRPI